MKKWVLALLVAAVGAAACLLVAYWRDLFPDSRTQPSSKGPSPAVPGPMDALKGPDKGLRVLFVGNSHTFTHDVPRLVTKLAEAAGEDRPLLALAEAPGGTSFQMHWDAGRVTKLLGEVKWDLVVLQDQSSMPNQTRAQRQQETLPFARQLNDKARESGARTVLFMTWGYQQDYFPMQKRSQEAYQELAKDLKADLVPVGLAWEKALRSRPNLDLWSDGNHATLKGAYLAACSFYSAFYGKSPVGNSFTGGLDAAECRFLQETAAAVIDIQPGGLAAKAPPRNP